MATEVAIPEAPNPAPDELSSGSPDVVLDGEQYAIGWQHFPAKAGGSAYVVVRRGILGGRRLLSRYPLTQDGWGRAWAEFARLDPATAEKTRLALGNFYAARPPAGLRAFVPGLILQAIDPPADSFAPSRAYDLRFGEDTLQIARARSRATTAEYRYADVQAVQVTGFERISATSALEVFFFPWAATDAASEYRIHLRVQTADGTLNFWHAAKSAAEVARWLEPLNRGIQQVALAGAACRAQRQTEWLTAELARLADLLEHGTLTVSDINLLQSRISGGF